MVHQTILTVYSSLTFEGRPINAIDFRGRRCVVAREVGAALGYAQDGKRFADQVTTGWADDFIEGQDFVVLQADDLAALKALGTTDVPSRTRAVTVLYESGVHKALLRTTKPAGVRLRDLLAREVMPQLTRTGEYTPARAVTDSGDVVSRATGAAVKPATEPANDAFDLRVERERRLQRKDKARGLKMLADLAASRGLSQMAETYRLKAGAALSGEDVTDLLLVDKRAEWMAPEQIAEVMGPGVFPQTVGRLITSLGLKDDPDHCEAVMNKARGHGRQVTSYRYSPAAVVRIRQRHLSYLRSSPARLRKWQAHRREAGLSPNLEGFEAEVLRESMRAA